VNLKSAGGKEVFRTLLKTADVLLEKLAAQGRRRRSDGGVDVAALEARRHADPGAGRRAVRREVLSDPHLHARDMIVELEHPVRGRHVTVGNPIKLSASPTKITPAPLLGEHRREILTELGYGETEIVALEADGAI
jgi:crotonobetainyl-CoA:carnitine CoA-transferase CaiB-like acyl-CoA transferase